MNTIIYLIRHGDYENPLNIFHARLPGFPLSPKGHEQAQRLAQKLSSVPLTAVYSSPLTRTYQTAQAIASPRGLTVRTDDRLMDLVTPLQGKPIPYMESIKWNFFRPEFIARGGETLRAVFARMHASIMDIVSSHPGEHVAVVSHGDPIMAIKVKYLGNPLYSRKLFYPYVAVTGGFMISIDESNRIKSVTEFSS